MTQTLLAAADLTSADRCDRCGAQAFLRAVLASGELLFCAHHGREHASRLNEVALELHDATARVDARPSPSAH